MAEAEEDERRHWLGVVIRLPFALVWVSGFLLVGFSAWLLRRLRYLIRFVRDSVRWSNRVVLRNKPVDVPVIGLLATLVCGATFVYWQDWNDADTTLPTTGMVLLALAAGAGLYLTVAAWRDLIPFIGDEDMALRIRRRGVEERQRRQASQSAPVVPGEPPPREREAADATTEPRRVRVLGELTLPNDPATRAAQGIQELAKAVNRLMSEPEKPAPHPELVAELQGYLGRWDRLGMSFVYSGGPRTWQEAEQVERHRRGWQEEVSRYLFRELGHDAAKSFDLAKDENARIAQLRRLIEQYSGEETLRDTRRSADEDDTDSFNESMLNAEDDGPVVE